MSKPRTRVLKANMVTVAVAPLFTLPKPVQDPMEQALAEANAALRQSAVSHLPAVGEEPQLQAEGRPRPTEPAAEAIARAEALENRASLILAEAEEVAEARLAEAARKVEEMLSRAAEAAVEITRQAQHDGHSEGWEDGYQEGLAAARAEAEAICQDALAERDRILSASRDEVVALAMAVARQVLKAELAASPGAVVQMVQEALSRMRGEERPSVRISPTVAEGLAESQGALLAALRGARAIDLIPDASLQPGDFVVQGDRGRIDGRIEAQLETVEAALRRGFE